MYSQGNEEAFIVEWFDGRRGRFLDIGASDGIRYSNTRRLFELGWHGVLVEPSPATFAMLLQNYRDHNEIMCVNCAVASEGGFRMFWASLGEWFGVSSLDNVHVEQWRDSAGRHGTTFLPMWLRAVSAPELLGSFPGPYDFVTIDAEGISWSIASTIPWCAVDAELICVEIDDETSRTRMDEFFKQLGYEHVHGDRSGNAIYGARKVVAL